MSYENGMDSSTGTYVAAYLAAGILAAMFVLVVKPELIKMIRRFDLERGLNGDHTLHKLEELYGSYHNFILLSAVTHLLRAVIVQNYPHTDQHAGTPTGWEVFSRIMGLTYFQTLASLSLSAKNAWFTAEVTANHPVTKWGTRILAFLFIVLSVVSLAIPRDSGIMLGVTLMCAAIPPFATSAIALKVEPDAPLRLGEGRFFICVFSVAMMGCGAWVVGWDHNCSTTNARCNAGCPFEDSVNHNFWFHIFYVLATGVLCKALVTIPGKPDKFRERIATFDAPKPDRPNPKPEPESIPMRDNPTHVNPAHVPVDDPPAGNTPEDNAPAGNTPEADVPAGNTPHDPAPNPPAAVAPGVSPSESDDPAASSTDPSSGGRGRLLEDSLLPKMYKLFTAADDGKIDLADAGLTQEEFKAKLTVGRLQEALAPIGGLDLTRVDPKLKDAKGQKVDIARVFEVLDADANKRVTVKEFLALITKAAPKVYSKMIEDSALKKMYDLFTASDSTPIDLADAGLSPAEFKATVSIDKLREALEPVGGLDMARIDPKFTGDSSKLTNEEVFRMLDKNGDDKVTMTEFVKLLRKKSSRM